MGIFDVNTARLIDELAEEFRKQGFEQPAFVDFVKTGMHRERAPTRNDWYYVRMASILYRLCKEGPLGTGSLRTYYGGRKNRGTRPHHTYRAGGKIIRTCLQELEKKGLVKKAAKGRAITGKGQKLMNEKSKVVASLAAQDKEKKAMEKEHKKKVTEDERKVKEELRKMEHHKKPEHAKQEKKEKHEKKKENQ